MDGIAAYLVIFCMVNRNGMAKKMICAFDNSGRYWRIFDHDDDDYKNDIKVHLWLHECAFIMCSICLF